MDKLLDFFFPPRCQLCGDTSNLGSTGQLCVACTHDLQLNLTACRHCAVPLNFEELNQCGKCIKSAPVYDSCWSPFIYAQPLEWMIQQLKFNAKLSYAPLLSNLMISNLPEQFYKNQTADVIIPMPLHNSRLKQRGFNQSSLLAAPLAKALGLPVDTNSCQRILNTDHQTGKNARQRQQNIKNAFTFNNHFNYRHVLVFDDVVTTGSSVAELSKTIKLAGVNRVDVWSLARAERNH